VGRVIKPHGVHGSVLVKIVTDFPERMTVGTRFGLGPEDGPDAYHEAATVRYHGGHWLVAIRGVRQREAVEPLRGQYLFLPEQALEELPEGYYYEHHLVGLRCESPTGENLGVVRGLDAGEAQSRLIVRRDDRDYLVPYVPQLVQKVDLEQGRVIIDPIPGLLDHDAIEA
jgi:16S rRNA processing protein RimM